MGEASARVPSTAISYTYNLGPVLVVNSSHMNCCVYAGHHLILEGSAKTHEDCLGIV